MSVELRDGEAVERWLGCGLCLMRLQRPSATALGEARPWLEASVAESPRLPPAGLIADLGALLEGRPLRFGESLAVSEPGLRQAIRRYEDHLLARIVADPHYDAAVDAYAALAPALRPAAVALVVEQLVERTAFVDHAVSLSPAVARRLLQRPGDEILALGLAQLRRPTDEVGSALTAGYRRLVYQARHSGVLLSDRVIFVLENLAVLRSRAQRLSIEQIVEAAEQLARTLPRQLRRRASHGPTPTAVQDDSVYPAGGFSGISNSGPMENLVCSELVYMDEQDETAEEVDLFDVRYAEGELLFYTRDDNVHVRRQRAFTIALLPDLVAARFKDAALPWQRLVLALSLLLCLVRKLGEWLAEEALSFRIVFVADEVGTQPLSTERDLCGVLFGEWIERGTVVIEQFGAIDQLHPLLAEDARFAATDLIVFGAGPLPELPRRTPYRCCTLTLAGRHPRLVRAGEPEAEPAEGPAAWRSWAEIANALMRYLV